MKASAFPAIIFFGVVILMGIGAGSPALAGEPKPAPAPSPAPEARFTKTDGTACKLSDVKGQKAVVLLFMRGFKGEFACHFCSLQVKDYKTHAGELEKAGAEAWVVLPGAKDGKEFYAMVGTDDADNPEPDFTAPFPVLLDNDFSACKAFGVPFDPGGEPFPVSQPATVVVGKDGAILYAHQGEKVADRPTAQEILDVLTGKDRTSSPSKSPAQPPVAPISAIEWLPYEKGLEAAKAKRKPVLIDFYADW